MQSIQNLFSAVGGILMGKNRTGGVSLDRAIAESHLEAMKYTNQPLPRL